MEQRYVPLSFTAGDGALTATVPANVNTAVPGVYMLFTVDSSGVPSVAQMVQLDAAAPPPPPTTAAESAAGGVTHVAVEQRQLPVPGQALARRNAPDADRTVARVEFFNGTTKLGEDTTAPSPSQWKSGGRQVHAHGTSDRQRRRNKHQQPGRDHHHQEALKTASSRPVAPFGSM
jgi:hypothetical protein